MRQEQKMAVFCAVMPVVFLSQLAALGPLAVVHLRQVLASSRQNLDSFENYRPTFMQGHVVNAQVVI